MSCRACEGKPPFPDGFSCPLCPALEDDASDVPSTIASDFYGFLKTFGEGAVQPGTPGRNLHDRIALYQEEAMGLVARYADLQREHARVKAEVVLWKAEAAAHTGGAVSLDEIRRAYEATK